MEEGVSLLRLLLFTYLFVAILAAGGHESVGNNVIPPSKIKKTRTQAMQQDSNRKTRCMRSGECIDFPADCMECNFNKTCVYGQAIDVDCKMMEDVTCEGSHTFKKSMMCSFCYQLPEEQYSCSQNDTCKLGNRFRSLCQVKEDVLCMGRRSFYKMLECNYASGMKWSTALILSITLGGFGVDRFYMGNWQEGVGKLFSFGGLGVWTLLDVILIATGYLKPGDSRYA